MRVVLKYAFIFPILLLASTLHLISLVINLSSKKIKCIGKIPVDKMMLAYSHLFIEERKTPYVAVEFDLIRLNDKGDKATIYWIVVSNAGVKVHTSLISLPSRKIIRFNNKRIKDSFVVLWVGKEVMTGKVKIYDLDFVNSGIDYVKYCGKRIKVIVMKSSRITKHDKYAMKEVFNILYDEITGIDVLANNLGVSPKKKYRELYILTFDNINLLLKSILKR